MKHFNIHGNHDFFEYIRLDDDSLPPASPDRIDVALLDMNHSWPNVGHDALVHVILKATEPLYEELASIRAKVRVLSFDVRRRQRIPPSPNGRFKVYLGTGGPGHLDPRLNDGKHEWSQGVDESDAWEAPLFRLYDDILEDSSAVMLAICHSFGLVCRWSGIARPVLRDEKSSGMPLNRLSREALRHPWFQQFARELPDRQHFRVIDNRLFNLMLDNQKTSIPIAFETEGSTALTMVELARDRDGVVPRFLGVNYHPEIVDRDHIMRVLDEKRAHGDVSEQWYSERATTMRDLFKGEEERQSRLTSHYTLIAPLRHHLERVVRDRG
ncbi:MAG TPA: hypothetical protein VEK57_30425 [Thermoanaerobaculia bacterium]|nr:hypothetical protein [Thermoanaerobaculia bacterium]